jgi:hypothetical protein
MASKNASGTYLPDGIGWRVGFADCFAFTFATFA